MNASGASARRTVFFVSDGTAITTETVGHTLLSQFESYTFRQVTVPFVDSVERAQSVADSITRTASEEGVRPIVFSSLVNRHALEVLGHSGALVLDVFAAFAGGQAAFDFFPRRPFIAGYVHFYLSNSGTGGVGEVFGHRFDLGL